MDETKQWEALKAGDIQALRALYDLYSGALFGYGMVLCHDAEKVRDSIHDLFLFCWTHRHGMSIPTHGKAYMMVSLRRRIFEKGPKSQQLTSALEEVDFDAVSYDDPETEWIKAEDETGLEEKLRKALSHLSDRQREIIHMKYFQQMEYEDIAQVMDLNYQSARNLVNRALVALRKGMIGEVMILLLLL